MPANYFADATGIMTAGSNPWPLLSHVFVRIQKPSSIIPAHDAEAEDVHQHRKTIDRRDRLHFLPQRFEPQHENDGDVKVEIAEQENQPDTAE